MKYELAILAALIQLEKPTRPQIAEETGISAQRINTAIHFLKELMDIEIEWYGAKKTGHYEIKSWGAFETGKAIRRKAYALNLSTYKAHRKFEYNAALLKKHYANEVKRRNYQHSLRLEGFETSKSDEQSRFNASERMQRRKELKSKYMKPALSAAP